MRIKIIAIAISLILSLLFLKMVLTPPSVFNLLPYSIHRSFSPDGSGEKMFIIIFDLIIALLLFYITYKIALKIMK